MFLSMRALYCLSSPVMAGCQGLRVFMVQTTSKRRFVVFGVVALALLVSTMNLTVAFVVLPQMTEGLNASLTWVGWTITAYQLTQAVSMSLAGKVSDQLGRRRTFMVSLAIFSLGSLGAALAPNVSTHILLRMVAALGGGAIMPVAAAIVSLEFPKERAKALGLFTSIMPIGWILGPTVGGLIADEVSWRAAFLMPLPFAALAIVGSAFLIRESSERKSANLDLRGAALLTAAIAFFMLALSLFRVDTGTATVAAWALLLASAPIAWLFWRHEAHTEDAIVDPALLRLRPFVAANIYNVIWGAASIGSSAFIPFYAMVQFGFESSRAGAVLIGLEVALIVGSTVTSLFLLRRVGYRPLLLAGGVVMSGALLAVGVGVFDVLPDSISPFWALFGVLAVAGLGMGIQAPASNNAGIELMPSHISSIVGLRGMFRFAGSVIATTLIFFLLSGSEDTARGVEIVYLGLAVLMFAAAPIIMLMPTGRERRIDQQAEPYPTP